MFFGRVSVPPVARVVPPEASHVSAPVRVSLNRTGPEPVIAMDLGPGVLGFAIDRASLTHVLQMVMTHYPTGTKQ
jgi:hypothetical protein